ncbi:hypothetical protein TRAPUB_4950 [Trametes pubescens]|uniref:Uncharacterized protein n=1 Tax=Trametes pubescens TaxID=154538 RepID=A0A1M2V9T7_TRAPU|nr:hypothetical protein TRAPUB_4950 [Trametes pubescens]
MPRIDPPYPSFTFVLSKPLPRNDRSSRLPAYRASHMGRYHPYARVAPSQCQDRLMNTIDYRYADEPLWEETVGEAQGVTTCESLSDNDNDSAISPVVDAEHENAAESPALPQAQLSRSKLVATLTDVLVALRRHLALQAVRSFLKAEHLKGPRA